MRKTGLVLVLCAMAAISSSVGALAAQQNRQLTSEDVLKSFRQDKFSFSEGIMAYQQSDDASQELITTAKRAYCLVQYSVVCYDMALQECDKMVKIDPRCEAQMYIRALVLTRKQKYQEAVKILTEALQIVPDDVNAYVLRAQCNAALHHSSDYTSDMNAAIRCSKSPGYLYVTRARIYLKMGNREAALEDIASALKVNPKDSSALRLRSYIADNPPWQQQTGYALTLSIIDDYEFFIDGVKDYTAQLKKKPRDPFLILKRSFCYFQTGDFKNSFADANQLVSIDSHAGAAYYMRGASLQAQGKLTDAIIDLNRAIQLLPIDSDSYCMLGATYSNLGKHDESMRAFNRSLELDPSAAEALRLRATEYLRVGDISRADADIRNGLQLSPDTNALLTLYGICDCLRPNSHRSIIFSELAADVYLDRLSMQKAKVLYELSLKQTPNNLLLVAKHAFCCCVLGGAKNYQLGSRDAQRMLHSPGTRQVAHYLRALMFLASGDVRNAESEAQQAIQLCPYDADAYKISADCHTGQRHKTQALADLINAINLQPFSADPYAKRAELYFQVAESAKARADVEAGLKLSPNHDMLVLLKVQMDLDDHDMPKALSDLTSAINATHSSFLILDRMNLYHTSRQYQLEIKDCNQLIAQKIMLNKAYKSRAEANYRLGNFTRALADYDKLRQVAPAEWQPCNEYADCYFRAGQFQKAIDIYSELIAADSGDAAARLGRARAYDKIGKTAQAAIDRTKAVQIHDDLIRR